MADSANAAALPSKGAVATAEQWVEAPRLSGNEWWILVGLPIEFAIGLAAPIIFVLRLPNTPADILIGAAATFGLAAAAPVFVGTQHVRRMSLNDAGVTLVTGWRTAQVPWNAVRPWRIGIRLDFLQAAWARSKLDPLPLFVLSRDQARAILRDPRAPLHLFPAHAWTDLGLPPPTPTVP